MNSFEIISKLICHLKQLSLHRLHKVALVFHLYFAAFGQHTPFPSLFHSVWPIHRISQPQWLLDANHSLSLRPHPMIVHRPWPVSKPSSQRTVTAIWMAAAKGGSLGLKGPTSSKHIPQHALSNLNPHDSILSHFGLLTSKAWANLGSDDTKLLAEPMLTFKGT